MRAAPRLLVTLLLAATVASAGCFGKGGDDDLDAASADNTTNFTQPEVLPDGREFVAVEETNKTEEGVGGIEHKHDYWKGQEQVVIYDFDISPSGSFMERGDNSKVGIYFVNLEFLPGEEDLEEDQRSAALVYEGTGKVTFEISGGPPSVSEYQMSFRTAAKDWSAYAPIALATPIEYLPEKIETDMPHSFRSLWNWKLQATGPVPIADPLGIAFGSDSGLEAASPPLHVKVTVTKARNVDDWPGHPAFYDGVDERVVAENKEGSTTVQQAADVLIYGVEPDQVVPDKLISMGSKTLDVYVNISSLTLPPGVPNGGFTLYWRTADTRPDDLGIFSIANETDDATYAYFHLDLEDSNVDSPYQPTSRFGFKLLANPVNDDQAACYRCVPYTIEYTMTVIARPDPAAAAAAIMEG